MMKPARRRSPAGRQRGAALLTAMIIVALVATLAAAMVWQQWRAVQVEGAERARAQSSWILTGARDFAGLILREDFKGSVTGMTTLNEPWATPLQEGRLSTFLAIDKANSDDPEGFLSGYITDVQARFNLYSVVPTTQTAPGTVDADAAAALKALRNLCEILGLDGSVADRIATGLTAARSATSAGDTANAPLEPRTVEQLAWLGIDPDSIKRLAPFVVLLKDNTGAYVKVGVNVNTAPKEVLAAIANIDQGTAERIVQFRQRTPFRSTESFRTEAKVPAQDRIGNIGIGSDYFEVNGSLRLGDHVLTERSIVRRQNRALIPLQRERIAALQQTGQ